MKKYMNEQRENKLEIENNMSLKIKKVLYH